MMSSMTSNRRVFARTALVLFASALCILACSSDDRPVGAVTGTTTSSTSSGSTGSSSSSGSATDGGGDGSLSDASSSGSSSGTPDATVEAGTPCVGDVPITKDGGTLPSSCPDSASCSARCTKIAQNFRIGLAQSGIACLRGLSSCDDTPAVFRCLTAMIGLACTDSTATTFCSPLVTACDPNAGGEGSLISTESCASFVSALTPEGRATFKTCMDGKIGAGTCATDVGDCFAALQ